MREQILKTYRCEFCKKRLLRRDAMERHEKACTGNPDRYCKMCDQGEMIHATMPELLAAAFKGLDELREVSGNCPACILAGIRRAWKVNPPDGDESGWTAGGGHSSLQEFQYKPEVVEFWKHHPRNEREY